MAEKNLLQAIHDGLAEEMRTDDSVMILGEDVGRAGGVFRATQGLAEEFGAQRAMDTPLAESLIVGAAIGLSVNGMRPVAEIQFADFITPAFDQIVNEAARFYYRSNGAWSCPMTIRAPYGAVPGGALYHSQRHGVIVFGYVLFYEAVGPFVLQEEDGVRVANGAL